MWGAARVRRMWGAANAWCGERRCGESAVRQEYREARMSCGECEVRRADQRLPKRATPSAMIRSSCVVRWDGVG
jgi:hypothetical protein